MPALINWMQAAMIAERLWQRDPLAFLAICAGARAVGCTLLERIRQRAAELAVRR